MSFVSSLKNVLNTNQSRAVLLTGNIYDLFLGNNNEPVPLIELLLSKTKFSGVPGKTKGIIPIIYPVNKPVQIGTTDPKERSVHVSYLKSIWEKFHNDGKTFETRLQETIEISTYALEFLRQLVECNRNHLSSSFNLLIIIEAIDMLLPETQIDRLSVVDRKRLFIMQDWLADPKFVNGHDSVVMIGESRSSIHSRISRLPQVIGIEIPLPNLNERLNYIKSRYWGPVVYKNSTTEITEELADKLAEQTAGLSLHAIRQLLCSGNIETQYISLKVEEYMVSMLGDGVVEFKRPTHHLNDVIGFSKIKKFFADELIPAFKINGKDGLSGVAVAGPIGSGKTFVCEAIASELDCPVVVLKNIRSKWYGETDQIFERLKRLLESFSKIVIFVDEADTMFGDIQSDQETERRLTGKIQSMMSDPLLRGKVIWFLMTARIHRLSPDIRRPGRIDIIIPILDPNPYFDAQEKEDFDLFVKWTFGDLIKTQKDLDECGSLCDNYSSASFSCLRTLLKNKKPASIQEAELIASDLMLPDIDDTRRYQSLQAKLNCTRKSLIGKICVEDCKKAWREEVMKLEAKGIK